MLAVAIDADVDFVDFDQPNIFDKGLLVILQRVAGNSEKCVDQAIASDCGEKRLLVCECVIADDFVLGVRYLNRVAVGTWKYPDQFAMLEAIVTFSAEFDAPFHPVWTR